MPQYTGKKGVESSKTHSKSLSLSFTFIALIVWDLCFRFMSRNEGVKGFEDGDEE